MKKSTLILLLSFYCFGVHSQEHYSVDGQSYLLKKEVDGTWDLLWNVIEGEFRYFIKTDDDNIYELRNTKDANGKFQNEYKRVLYDLSNGTLDTNNIKLTLDSLKQAFDGFNSSKDSNYSYTDKKSQITTRLGAFGGLTNHPFIDNPDNKFSGLLGLEFELYDNHDFKRHAGFVQIKHAFENKDLEYSITEIALGYRFRFIYTTQFNIHANLKFATLSFSNATYSYTDGPTNEIINQKESSTLFDAPLTLGLGADFKVSARGFITLYYNEIISVFSENKGNFPINFALGYKIDL